MKKRTHRKHWPLINTVAHAIDGAAITPDKLLDELRLLELSHLSAMRDGTAGLAQWRALVDTRGSAAHRYEADLSECQQYAHQRAGAAQQAVAGAIFGALVGVALGAAIGGGIRNEMAGIGALTGGLQGAGQGEGTQRDIIRRCLAGRGHSVLD